MNYGDPTIPKSRAGVRRGANAAERAVALGPTVGRLVDWGSRGVVLTDRRGNDWSQDRVRWVGGSFGFSSEGLQKPPRPWLYDSATGKPIIEGDELIIDFLDGDPEQPFVRGGVRSLQPLDETYFDRQPIGLDPNQLRFRMLQLDPATGKQLRFLDAELDADTGRFEVRVGLSSTATTAVRVELDPTLGTCKIGSGGESQRVLLGDKILTDLLDVAAELIAIGLATIPPTPAPNTTALLASWAADVANPLGNASLSGVLKTE